MGERGSVLVPREQWHPGWEATRVLEQVRELLRRSAQELERVRREQEHLVLAVRREREFRLLLVESLERKVTW